MTQQRSAVVFTNSSTGLSSLLGNVMRQTGIVPVLPHQLPGNSNGVSLIIIERQLDRAETICANLRKYQEYAQMPILVLAETVDKSRQARFEELKAVVLPPPLTEAAVREFLTQRLSELNAAESREATPKPTPAAETEAGAAPKPAEPQPRKAETPQKKVEPQPAPAGDSTHAAPPTPKGAPTAAPRPPAAPEPPPRPAAAREVRKAVRPEKDREDEVPASARPLTGQPDLSALPSGSVRCSHCPRWHVRREDAFCSRCGSPLIVLKASPAAAVFEPRGNHTVGKLVSLKNAGQNPLRMAFRINASGEMADRLLMSAPAAALTGGASGDLLVELDARGLDLSGGYEATLEITTNEGPNARHLIPLSVERLPRPRLITRGEYVYSLNELHQPNQWEFGLANEGGRTLRLKGVKMSLSGGNGDSPLELLGPSPVVVGGGQTVQVGVRLPELKLAADSYSGTLTFLFEQSDPVTLGLDFEAKKPRYLTVRSSEFVDFGVVSTRRPQTYTLQLRNTGDADSLMVESVELKPPYPWATFKNAAPFPLDIVAGAPLLLEIQLDGSGMAPDVYDGELVVRSNSYGNPVLSIPFSIEFKEPEVFDGYMGIDFGTTASCVAVLEKRNLRSLPIDTYGVTSEADGVLMPSVLYFLPDGKVVAGREAQRPAQIDPANAVNAIKRELGMRDKQRKAGRDYEATELAALVIKELRERAEHALFKAEEYKTPRRAVLTVPVDFVEKQRRALLEASSRAGLDNYTMADGPTVLDEALAVALYYQWKRAEKRPPGADPERVLVFDFGGGTLDCGLIEIRHANEKRTFETLATYGDSHLGGEDIDWALVEVLAEMTALSFPELDRRCLKRMEPGRMLRLYRNESVRGAAELMRYTFKEGAERAKKELCTKGETAVTVGPLLRQGALPGSPFVRRKREEEGADDASAQLEHEVTFEGTLRQEDFKRVLKPFVERAIRVVEVVCARAGLRPEDVTTILHAGRSSLIPTIKQRVKEFLPNATDRTDLIEPKVCVALGAACYGRIKTFPTELFEIIGGANRVAHDIGYIDLDPESGSEVFIPVITAQTPFPADKEVRMRGGGRVVDLQVAENRGISNVVADNPDIVYGEVVRVDARGSAEEETPVVFGVNDDGLLEVRVNGEVQRIIDMGD